jgi:phosphotriesterase-related protein
VLVRAAARAGAATGVVIGSHTVAGRVASRQVDIIEEADYAAGRFIWIHAQVEPEFTWNLELARRGAWIEYDGIGDSPADVVYVDRILRMWDAGYGGRILLSQDRGWYDPVKPGGGVPKPYTYLTDIFLPKLAAEGLSDQQIRQMTTHNPFNAYATDHTLRS